MSFTSTGQRWLMYLLTRPQYGRFISAAGNPERAHDAVWKEIKALLRKSKHWQGLFRENLDDYDITDLSSYQPAIRQSLDQQTSLLNHERIVFWSQSAGTTGDRKLFPMTPTFRRQFQRTVSPMVHGLLRRYAGFVKTPVLYFAATDPEQSTAAGIGIGFISNYNYRTIPLVMRSRYAFPRELLRDGATFAKYSPVYALATDLSAMFAVTPLSFAQLIQRIHDHTPFVLSCLKGDLPPGPRLPKPRISPARLEYVSSCLRSGDLRFRKLWPSLEFVCTWKTAVCAAHLREISQFLEGIEVLDAIYSATEGWVSVPLAEAGGSVLHPGAHICEFIKVGEEIRRSNLVPPWDLEQGKNYEIFLTTAMGMVRYRLFDVVKCTGFFHRSPIIEFVQKSGSMISLGLVTVGEAELLESLAVADIRLSSAWRVGPNRQGNGLTLFVDKASAELEEQLILAEEHLRRLNVNYEIYIANKTMQPLSYAVLPKEELPWADTEAHAQIKPVLLIQHYPGIRTSSESG